MKPHAVNSCIRIAVNSSDQLPLPFGERGPFPIFDYNGTASGATSFSDSWFQDDDIIHVACGEYPETLIPVSDTLFSLFQTRYPRRGLGLEQDDVDQIENFWPTPNLGAIPSAGPSSGVIAALCIPAGVTYGYNVCITEEDAEREVRVGREGYATRWTKGSVLRYIVCAETFPSLRLAALVAGEMAKAAWMWKKISKKVGVPSFQKVDRDAKATFAIKYCLEPDNCRPNVYARAFFPQTKHGELFVYQFALDPINVGFLANILAHELGHILGLSHEFEDQTTFLLGKMNDRSIMNYFKHPRGLQVGEEDRDGLEAYYEYDGGQHDGLSIRDIKPRLHRFSESNNHDVRRRRLASKRRLIYRIRRSRFRCGPLLVQQTDQGAISSRISISSISTRFLCGFVLFASFICFMFLLRQT